MHPNGLAMNSCELIKIKIMITREEYLKAVETIKQYKKQLRIGGVVRSADVNIVDSDIATIEALHDLLLDAHGYSLDFITLKKVRELTAKMYKALY